MMLLGETITNLDVFEIKHISLEECVLNILISP